MRSDVKELKGPKLVLLKRKASTCFQPRRLYVESVEFVRGECLRSGTKSTAGYKQCVAIALKPSERRHDRGGGNACIHFVNFVTHTLTILRILAYVK